MKLGIPDTLYDQTDSGINRGMFISISILVIGVSALFMVPNFMRARSSGKFTQCQSNCKNMGTALKMYYDDNDEIYPASLMMLTPDYLRIIPSCSASESTSGYIKSYQVSSDFKAYTFYCMGKSHGWVGVEKDYPQFTSREGLRTRSK